MDTKVKDALDQVRASAQELHKAITDAAARRGGAVKADLETVAKKAKAVAESAKSSMAKQNDAAKKYLAEVLKRLEAVQKDAADVSKDASNSINVSDLITLANFLAGNIKTLPLGN